MQESCTSGSVGASGEQSPEATRLYEYAVCAYPGPWLFPHADGTMRDKTWQPEDILRRALKRAGIVTGYTHKCRRRGCGHEETHADAGQRRCPRCRFALWPRAT